MARLQSPRQEQFARLVAAGVEPAAAYGQAGYKAAGAGNRAAALAARPTVAARIWDLALAWERDGSGRRRGGEGPGGKDGDEESGGIAPAVTEDGPGRNWVVARLVETAERALQAVPVTDRKGEPTGEFTYQGSVALRALELLGRELGMFTDRKVAPEGGVEALSDDELERRARQLAQAVGIGQAGGGC